jgi:DNA-binding transcriptional MerR regulator
MSTTAQPSDSENGTFYSLEILSEMTGVSQQTILLYQEHGIIRAAQNEGARFTDDTIRLLRRIEHLREVCETNLAGLKLLTQLLDEVEQLRAELRAARR